MIAQHLLLSCLRPLLLARTHAALHRESEHFIVTLKADILPCLTGTGMKYQQLMEGFNSVHCIDALTWT